MYRIRAKERSLTPKRVISLILRRLFPQLMLERDLHKQYFQAFGRAPNIRNPKLFTEKLQHRKIFDKDPRFSLCADKVLVKDYVRAKLGDDILIPTLFSGPNLPPLAQRNWNIPFVIKANHGSYMNVFVRTKADLDWPRIENKLCDFLATDFSVKFKELHYSKIERKLIVEPFLSDNDELPLDFKFFVFSGSSAFIQVDTCRENDHKRVFYDAQWNRMNICFGYQQEPREIKKPSSLDRMLAAASVLGRDFDFVRIDFYEISGRPYFGEMTFTPEAGLKKFEPPEIDLMLGQLWSASARTRS